MTTPPTDYKALADATLRYVDTLVGEDAPVRATLTGLARAVLALDKENEEFKERLLVEEGAFSHTSVKKTEIEAENQRLRTAARGLLRDCVSCRKFHRLHQR